MLINLTKADIMQKIILTAGLILLALVGKTQEFKTTVTINLPKLQTADPRIFETMETALEEFMNTTKWTEDEYKPEERIEINLQINVKEENSATSFDAEMFIQALRPIYGSRENTALLEHADKNFQFSYTEYQPLEFSENSFNSNLTSFMGFYAYMILGLDYDSFEREGGTPYFQKAQDIINTVPANTYKGWSSLDNNRNRYWMVESILSPRATDLRTAMYDYHRLGLDLMQENAEVARQNLSGAIQKMKAFSQSYPNAMSTQMFVNAKRDEIVNIFKGAPTNEKRSVHSIMVRLDPANASRYSPIRR